MTEMHRLVKLRKDVEDLYKHKTNLLPFHGWHHINFVRNKAIEFGGAIAADSFLVESAALTHDLNYVVEMNSGPEKGAKLRQQLLVGCGYSEKEVALIERIIIDSHTEYRADELSNKLSEESMALSDADTLFKALPITPILFAHRYVSENSVDISTLAKKIVEEQSPLMKAQIYFYTAAAKEKYLGWAQTNLTLWKNVIDALNDISVRRLLAEYDDLTEEKSGHK